MPGGRASISNPSLLSRPRRLLASSMSSVEDQSSEVVERVLVSPGRNLGPAISHMDHRNASAFLLTLQARYGNLAVERLLTEVQLPSQMSRGTKEDRLGGARLPTARLRRPAPTVQRAEEPSSMLKSIGSFFNVDPKELTEDLGAAVGVILGEPLTAEEMNRALLMRRAMPLSIPASQMKTAPQRVADIDSELTDLQSRYKRARGFPREMIKRQVTKLVIEKQRLVRGIALGTFGKGTTAGTGAITYAAIQVVDRNGRRIALEFAETSAVEHA
jgi:hypothetical protein